MSSEIISATISQQSIEAIQRRYGTDFSNKVIRITKKYAGDDGYIKRDAKRIIEDAGQRNTGDLINLIKPSVRIYANRVVGEIKAGTNYAKFIHDGAKHDGSQVKPHFVSFGVAPSLLAWAMRHKKVKMIGGKWYFIDKQGQKSRIKNIAKSGMVVSQQPLKYFEKPFKKYAQKYVDELRRLLQ